MTVSSQRLNNKGTCDSVSPVPVHRHFGATDSKLRDRTYAKLAKGRGSAVLVYFSDLKMEKVRSSETSVSCRTT
jgi:hypothetical protein